MCLCIETLRLTDGRLPGPEILSYHLARINRTRSRLWQQHNEWGEFSFLPAVPPELCSGIARCRIAYGPQGIERVEYAPYIRRKITSLLAVTDDTLEYGCKYLDRTRLTDRQQQARAAGCDEALIVRGDGRVTDTTIHNVAFGYSRDGEWVWHTPQTPLLGGTTRARLIDQGAIEPHDLRMEKILAGGLYSHIALFNALNDLGEILLPVSAIKKEGGL